MTSRRVLISGAGIAGPTLAYWLQRRDFSPTLLERAPAPRTGGYMIDFWGVGYDVAERMGLLPVIERDGYRIREVRLVDAAGRRVAGFDARVFRSATNNRFVSVLRGDLARRIYECVAGGIETVFGDTITAIDEDATGVTVTFEHATRRRFDLVIGADGLHSNVRTLVFGDDPGCERYLGYYTAAFTATDYPHRDDGAYVSYTVSGAQVARYALRDGRSAFFFMFAQPHPLDVAHHEVGSQQAILREKFAAQGWECDEILAAMDAADDLYFDSVSQVRMTGWSRGRVALVGDAAYCPSLLAGQGAALAMAGAYVLAHALQNAAGDHQAAFAEYQRQFKPFIDAKQRAAERFGWWFAPRTRLGRWFRDLTTNAMDLPLVSDRVVARTFGDRLELPE